jgi:hypothetical protein
VPQTQRQAYQQNYPESRRTVQEGLKPTVYRRHTLSLLQDRLLLASLCLLATRIRLRRNPGSQTLHVQHFSTLRLRLRLSARRFAPYQLLSFIRSGLARPRTRNHCQRRSDSMLSATLRDDLLKADKSPGESGRRADMLTS